MGLAKDKYSNMYCTMPVCQYIYPSPSRRSAVPPTERENGTAAETIVGFMHPVNSHIISHRIASPRIGFLFLVPGHMGVFLTPDQHQHQLRHQRGDGVQRSSRLSATVRPTVRYLANADPFSL